MACWKTNRSACAAILFATIVAHGAVAFGPLEAISSAEDDRSPRVLVTGAGRGYGPHPGVPSEGFGDDGDLVLGRLPALTYASVLTPTTQLQNVVLDENTGLMWVRSLSALDGTDGEGARGNVRLDTVLHWQAAIDTAAALQYAGFDDWRLPTVNELDSILDFGRSEPALDRAAFPESDSRIPSPYFWTSTTYPDTPSSAYYVNVRDGHRHPWSKRTPFAVRPVRRATGSADSPRDPGLRRDDATRDRLDTVVDRDLRVDVETHPPVAVLRTGQELGYRGTEGEPGEGNGDDGDLRPGEEHEYAWSDDGVIDTAAENIVMDRVTGLVWIRMPLLLDGGGDGADDDVRSRVDLSMPLTWSLAVSRCRSLDYAGHDDWRLPNIRELDSIVQPGRPVDPLDPAAFPGGLPPLADPDVMLPLSWWSSTTSAYGTEGFRAEDEAWYIEAGHPPSRHHVIEHDPPAKNHLRHARCVRDDHVPDPPPDTYLRAIRSSDDFAAMAADIGRERSELKWLLDADSEDDIGLPVPSTFQDTRRFPLHLDFLTTAFPERFGGLGPEDYAAIAGRRATRTLFAGSIVRSPDPEGGHRFGWDVYAADEDPAEAPTRQEIVALHTELARVFRRRPLAYSPLDPERLASAVAWGDPRVPVMRPPGPAASGYEAYTPGVTYGTVRRMTRAALEAAVGRGGLGRQDIVVVTDAAPTDLGQVVAGIVTAAPQGALSHLAVRAARRGTPNAYIDNAGEFFAPLDGRLVRLVLTSDRWDAAPATAAEADAWWAERRPAPVPISTADVEYTELDDLASIASRPAPATRFGGKATNLALLYTFLPSEHQVPGFAIPFAWFDRMLDSPARSSAPAGAATIREWITALADDPGMASGAVRAERLETLRDAIEDAPPPGGPDEDVVGALAERIDDIFGPQVMVRFRSSSNAEDGLRFNGAGLYDSTSVCAADTLDDDDRGPSHCDPDQPKERTIERGLGHVWASLHSLRAWEEREWYGIDQTKAAMAILVTTAFPDERANGVAFTGDPAAPESSVFLVSAQAGDESVVSPEPGVLPERSVLDVEDAGVTGIRRIQASTLVDEGELVLSDAELLALGNLMLLADERFPIDLTEEPGTERQDVMLDLEFKVRRGDDAILIKQIRPFLPPTPDTRATFIAPEPLALCGMWRSIDTVRQVHADRAEVDLTAGEARLPLERDETGDTSGPGDSSVPPDFIAALRLGPDRRAAVPLEPTTALVEDVPGRPDLARVAIRRTFRDPAGGPDRVVEFALPSIERDRLTIRMLDAAALTAPLDLVAHVTAVVDGVELGTRQLAPCGLSLLPTETIHVDFEGGGLRLDVRMEDARGAVYHRAALVGASVRLDDAVARVDDLARLVYASTRHGSIDRFLVTLPAPLTSPLGDVHAIELEWVVANPIGYVTLLDGDLRPLHREALPSDSIFRLRDANGVWRVRLPWGAVGDVGGAAVPAGLNRVPGWGEDVP